MPTSIITSRDHLDGLLLELEERGYGECAALSLDAQAFLLAAYELPDASAWDAFSSHPYSTEGDPAGLARQLDYEDEAAEGLLSLDGQDLGTAPIILAVASRIEHPGLDGLRYPLTVMHPAIGGPTPYLDERS